MLCSACHIHTRSDFPFCLRCGTARKGVSIAGFAPSELHPLEAPDVNFPLGKRCVTIGRNEDNDLVIDDGRVSRYHARIWRESDGYRLEDLDSMNGTFVNEEPLRGAGRRLNDGDTLRFGQAGIRFEQPRTALTGSRTVISPEKTTMLSGAVAGLHEGGGRPGEIAPLEQRPRRRSGWALKLAPSSGGELRYVLRNSRTGQFLQLTERDRFLWDRLDGEHTVRDLLFAYAQEYGQLALPRIQQLLAQLAAAGLLSGLQTAPGQQRVGLLRRIGRGFIRVMLRMEVSVSGIDRFLERLYTGIGWLAFTRAGLFVIWGLIVAGIFAFAEASKSQQLFNVAGAGVWGIIAALAGYMIALTFHEAAHALAVKSYGRTVRRGGLMFMMGMPYAFVDTTEMWFEGRWARIVVSAAGPVSTAALAGAVSLGAATAPGTVIPGVLFQIAFGLYFNTLINLNPLVPLDGYYVLSDWVQMPRLREEAGRYFRRGLWRDLRHGARPGGKQLALAVYGGIATLGTISFLLLAVVLWRARLSGVIRDHVASPFWQVLVVAGMLLVLFPVWYGPAGRVRRALRRRRRPEQADVELRPQPA